MTKANHSPPASFRDGTNGGPVALITGGAGFLGSNLADRLAREGHTVIIFDSLTRANVERNLTWLQQRHGSRIRPHIADIRDENELRIAVAAADHVFHLAAQVAVTTSLTDPTEDFEVNARGTLNVLEAVRACPNPPSIVFASSNKVYGRLDGIGIVERRTRYEAAAPEILRHGVSEMQPLSLYSPYGCSKGAADQYVLDYARVFGLRTVVFRMSCLYGPRQFGTEDQGWLAHFAISVLRGLPITIYGNGKQVRDALYVDDVVEAFLLAQANMARVSGQAFNIGGGPENAISLVELLDLLGKLHGRIPKLEYGPPRAGDQLYYVSDIRKFGLLTGWHPATDVPAGVRRLFGWLAQNHGAPATRDPARVPA